MRSAVPYILVLMLSSSFAGAAVRNHTETHKLPLTFAVVPGRLNGDSGMAKWVGVGIAFDLEKRLGRWQSLEPADRLQVERVIGSADVANEKATAEALLMQLHTSFVVTISGACSIDKLKLDLAIWMNGGTEQRCTRLEGNPAGLFDLQDSLIDKVVPLLRQMLPELPAPDPATVARMHVRSGVSVEAYGETIQGMTVLHASRPVDARTHLEKALKIEPNQWWAHYFLGAVHFHDRRFQEAAAECRTAIGIDPEMYAGVYANLAYCYAGLGDAAQSEWAAKEFERRSGKPLPMRGLPPMR